LPSQGTDAGKKIAGRKRGILTDRADPRRDRHRREPVGAGSTPASETPSSNTGPASTRRRLARDYEAPPASSEAMIHIASIDNLTQRTTDETALAW
jgi:hypothetical protein